MFRQAASLCNKNLNSGIERDANRKKSINMETLKRMQTRNRKVIRIICTMLSVGLLPLAWTGCVSTPTRESFDELMDDSTLTVKVKSAIYHDSRVPLNEVSVETWKGEVSLSGSCDNQDQINAAVEDARKTEGVTVVHNNLISKAN